MSKNINININIPSDDYERPVRQSNEDTTYNLSKHAQILINNIKQCYNWRNLFELKDRFQMCGLVIRPTTNNRMILCRVENGQPIYNSIIDDYIFIGKDDIDEEISERAAEVISDFVRCNATYGQQLADSKQSHQQIAFYGKPIHIANEMNISESQEMHHVARLINE